MSILPFVDSRDSEVRLRVKASILKSAACKVYFLLFLVTYATQAQEPDFDAERAWDYLLKQCSFGPRPPGSDAHLKCLKYLETELAKFAPSVNRQALLGINPVTRETCGLVNLIAEFWPERTRRILLCAHWDTRPWAGQDPDFANRDKPIIGANDGASGVAVLLEIARCLSMKDPGVGVDIVLFDGEDMGREGHLDEYCLGSRWYAQNLEYPFPEAAVLVDMVGDADLHIPQELYSRTSAPELITEIFSIAEELGESAFDPRPGRAVYDDHILLLQNGIPAVNLIDFDYDFWHTLKDIPENCRAQSLRSVGRVILAWVYQRGSRD